MPGMERIRPDLIGGKLRELRGDRTQKEVADAANVSVMAISKYERGLMIPSDSTKIALAEFYNTTVESLFFLPRE